MWSINVTNKNDPFLPRCNSECKSNCLNKHAVYLHTEILGLISTHCVLCIHILRHINQRKVLSINVQNDMAKI